MAEPLPRVYLARHGETEWSITGQHTGRTDIPLTERGESEARALGRRLKGTSFARVLSSPLQRAVRTAELAGFADQLTVDPDLAEWDYGAYEGLRTVDVRKTRPDWYIFRDASPDGETLAAVAERADRVIARIRAVEGDVLLFSHGHMLRFIATRWLGLAGPEAQHLMLSTASLSLLSYEHNLADPAIFLWNDSHHLESC